MLGRLLHLGAGSSPASSQPQVNTSRTVSSLDSVQEDIHTRNLLYPDAQALFQHRTDQVYPLVPASTVPPAASGSSTAFDMSDDVDLDVRDVRVLVMQDTLGHMNASLLYDSHPPPSQPPSNERPPQAPPAADRKRSPPVSRKGSLGQPSRPVVIQSDNAHARPGAFDRRGSHHSRSHSFLENESQRATREYREELATFASCIFGNSELMSYKGTSTKVHVVPTEARSIAETMASVIGDGRSSIGRSSSRSSKLSQSYTSQTFSPTAAQNGYAASRPMEKKKVLITRLFPVSLPDDSSDAPAPSYQGRFSDESMGFPFPSTTEDQPKRKSVQPRQRRTPMYAVVLVVQLPASRASTGATPKSTFRESGSYNEQDFFSSSYNSTRPSWWPGTGFGTYGDAESSFSTDVEDRIDSLTQHWDIVMRTLSHLQLVTTAALKPMLVQMDVASPDPFSTPVPANVGSARNQSLNDRRSHEMARAKAPKSTVKLISLGPNCLCSDVSIATEVNLARRRLVTGLKAARVVTGQGRWGIWRDEAIWTHKWTQSVNQGPFLYNLLTAFLATHTDWLQALCPPSYRRRFQHRKIGVEEDLLLPARTIVVAEDKMAARRLVFLLSAFLPANQQPPANRAHRSSTSMSTTGGASNSSPTFVIPVLREESLRRKINKRAGTRRASHSRTASQSTKSSMLPSQFSHLSMEGRHERRASDAASIRASSLAMPGGDFVSRKSSAATTATILPETTIPHFSTAQRAENNRSPRPESSGSIATDDLKRSLQRRESSGQASIISNDSRGPSSRWGSVISGLWSQRRQETTSMGSLSQFSEPRSPIRTRPERKDKLSQMVEEAALFEDSVAVDFEPQESSRIPSTGARRRDGIRDERISFGQADRKVVHESPVKTSVNEDDGVIDVDFPFPDYIASFESAISSPSSSGYLSTPGLASGLDSFEHSSRILTEGDLLLNAVGWLSRFHPDFALQAVPPQDDLVEQVKATLRAEPTPGYSSTTPHANSNERWVDVSSAVIADTTNNTVRRIHYRRLVKPRIQEKAKGGLPHLPGPPSTAPPAQGLSLPLETQLDEEFIEEMIQSPEPKLVEAIDKVISHDLAAREGLATSFPIPEDVRNGTDNGNAMGAAMDDPGQQPRPSIDMPRVQCKTIVLSALEEVIRDVVNRQEGSNHDRRSANDRGRHNVLHGTVQDWVMSLDAIE